MFFVGAFKISQFEKDFTEYDPYAVLELDRVSNDRLQQFLIAPKFLTPLEISPLCVCSLYPLSPLGWYIIILVLVRTGEERVMLFGILE